jgi:hypothetical protein
VSSEETLGSCEIICINFIVPRLDVNDQELALVGRFDARAEIPIVDLFASARDLLGG